MSLLDIYGPWFPTDVRQVDVLHKLVPSSGGEGLRYGHMAESSLPSGWDLKFVRVAREQGCFGVHHIVFEVCLHNCSQHGRKQQVARSGRCLLFECCQDR